MFQNHNAKPRCTRAGFLAHSTPPHEGSHDFSEPIRARRRELTEFCGKSVSSVKNSVGSLWHTNRLSRPGGAHWVLSHWNGESQQTRWVWSFRPCSPKLCHGPRNYYVNNCQRNNSCNCNCNLVANIIFDNWWVFFPWETEAYAKQFYVTVIVTWQENNLLWIFHVCNVFVYDGIWYSAKRAGVKRAYPNKVMAHMWCMHDAHPGRAFLFLDILAEYTLLCMTVLQKLLPATRVIWALRA